MTADSWTVTLADGKQFAASGQMVLLEEARTAGLALEHSCRTGRCGVCKTLLVRGETAVRRDEVSLTDAEREAGYILTCCRVAAGDLVLDGTDLGELADFTPKTMPARIEGLDRFADDVMSVRLRFPPGSVIRYMPGQYLDVIGPGGLRRSYSIANAPRSDGRLCLHIRRVEGGAFSAYWFEHANVNDLLRIHGPLGTFSLRSDAKRNLVFLATGTGIAPVKAMLEALAQADTTHILHVYWGGRTPADHYFDPVPAGMPVRYTKVLSRAPACGGGHRNGYVQQAVLDDRIPLADATVFACGSDAMIHAARAKLVEHGLHPRQFHSDAFVSSN
ncbi:2Fe-2S iron-sulfur cluster binding domain-containing protein [Caenimonas sedimenti]|uniref:2Fe-2S iron-sulfur cluster binding domain-containing protein n=1 Tax=Caenimonas sedimenti TaxID=2596921 RepID=A0A562ZUN0_9BURK|nr:FAD-binding oxidoreductase [Caenimonas sedimenti]TWO72302.1 2Fe-2S iron-sulfur cluster binding domain-containing protein [Caenimonas sedimenti]